jgi:PKD repeat protein
MAVPANTAPTAARTITQAGWTVIVTDTSTDDAVLPAGAVFVDWGDGTFQTGDAGSAFAKIYTVAGSYIIKHRVTDAGGLETWSADASVTVPLRYTVSGRVLRLDGLTPVSGASVRLRVGPSVVGVTITAVNGAYSFEDVAPDHYTVQAIKPGLIFPMMPTVIVINADVNVPIIKSTN